jgi:autotransporter adhesin
MNRIYRLIWNTALSCWMVASEHTKGRSKRARTVGAATLAGALALSTPVYADEPPDAGGEADSDSQPVLPQSVRDPFALPRASLFDAFEDRSLHWQSALVTDSYYENSTLSGDYSMVLGSRSAVTGNYAVGLGNRVTVDGHQATAVGTLAVARGAGATAFGTGATATNTNALALARESAATGNDAVAIGFSTRATGDWASAIGAWSQASGRYALAVGGSARATADYGTALGASSRAAGHSSVAIGSSSQAVGEYSVAIGDGTNVANTAANGVAIGRGAALGAGASRAVALGHDSVADQPDVVSVGNASVKRKIINVADGVVADKSTEVVNGGQLFNAMNKQFSGATVTMGDKAAVNGGYGVAIGAGSSVTTHGGVGGVALGHGATAGSPGYSGGIAVGGGARSTFDGVSLGHNAEATATRSIALGTASIANESHTVSVGSSSLQRRIVNVAAGNLSSSSNDAVTGKQLFQTNETLRATQATANVAQQQLNGTSVHIGSGATASAGQSIAMGDRARAEATASVAVGQQARASGPGALALGHASFATGQQSIAAGLRASADGQSAMALGMDASASGNYTTAFGHEAKASGAWTNAIGYMADASGSSSVAIGSLAKSTGTHSVAMGDRAEVNSAAERGVALGYSAGVRAGATESVALGYGSVATEKHVVSVGSSAVKRRIVNLAEGSETATSNEAITGAQLHRTQQSVTAVDGKATAAARTAADAATAATSAATAASTAKAVADAAALRLDNASTRLGQRATAGTNASALGNDAAASGSHSNAIGNAASSAGANAIAVGTLAAGASSSAVAVGNRAGVDAAASGGIALGANAKVNASASDAIALGAGSVATIKETVSVGSSGLQRRIVNVADGTLSASSTDAVTGRQLFAATQRLDTAEGTLSTTTTTANTAKTTADKADANATNALNKANVLGGLLSQAAAAGDVRLGGNNTGTVLDVRNKADKGRVIRGLAAGAVNATSTDAVNGGQLHSQQLKVDANDRRINTNLGSIATNQTNISNNQAEIAGNRGSIGVNGEAIAKLRSDLDAYAPELEGVVMFNEDRTRVDMDGARISGVQDGDVSLGSRDAVTGGQLFSTNTRIAEIEADATFVSLGEMLGSEGASAGLLGIAMGAFAEASLDGEGGVALGSFAAARGTNSVALGRGSHALAVAEEGFAMGTRSTVRAEGGLAAGARSEILSGATYSVALGYGSVAGEANTISVGSESVKRRVVNVARGRKVDDATTFGQLRDSLEKLGGGADVGASGEIVGPVYQLKSGDYTNVGAALTALDGRVSTTRDSVDILDARLNRLFREETSARTDDPGRLNLGGSQGMVLVNVANGMISAGSRDAVNGGQLYEVRKDLQGQIDNLAEGEKRVAVSGRMPAPAPMSAEGSGDAVASADAPAPIPTPTPTPTPVASEASIPKPVVKAEGDTAVAVGSEGKERSVKHVAKGTADTDAVNVAQLNDVLVRSNEYTDQAVDGLNKRLDGMDKRFNRMAAMSSAQSAMAMNTAGLNTYNRLGAGVGHSDGESALAVGYQRVMNERGSATFSLNGAFTNSGEKTVGVGVGIGW